MNKNNKTLNIISVVCSSFMLALIMVLTLIYMFANEQKSILYLIFALSIVLALFLIAMFVAIRINSYKNEEMLEKVNYAINKKLVGKTSLIGPLSDNGSDMAKLVKNTNRLIYGDIIYKKDYLYTYHDFKRLVYDLISMNLNYNAVLVRVLDKNMTKKEIRKYMKRLGSAYYGRGRYSLDYFLLSYKSKDEIEKKFKRLLEKEPKIRVVISYYPEVDITNMFYGTYPLYNNGFRFNITSGEHTSLGAIHEDIRKTLDPEDPYNSIGNLLYAYLSQSAYTHIFVKINDEIVKGVRSSGLRYFETYNKDEVGSYEEIDLNVSKLYKTTLVLAAVGNLHFRLTREEQLTKLTFIEGVRTLVSMYLNNIDHFDNSKIKDDILAFSNSYTYRIDKDYNIIEVSKSLEDKFADSLIGLKSYEAIYGETHPTIDSNMFVTSHNVIIPYLGSSTYHQVVREHHGYFDVYLIGEGRGKVEEYELLEDKLLDYLNNAHRGYVLCFKIESFSTLLKKYKISREELLIAINKTLSKYNLVNNLYYKGDDEYVYLLDGAQREQSYSLAERLSKAFNEKIELNGIPAPISIRVITMSYPVEVSTLFDLESLSRTLYRQADKKGKVYRIEEEPINVDRRRELIEILDASFQKGNIPLSYKEIKDKKEKEKLYEVNIDYKDSKGEAINSDEMRLIAKQEHFYSSLVERIVKQLNFDGRRYVIALSKEGLNESTFDAISTTLDAKGAKKRDILFEIREKDTRNNGALIDKMREQGYRFALSSLDTYIRNTSIDKYAYVRLEPRRLNKDVLYTLKLHNLINNGLDLHSLDKSDIMEGRYRY